MSGECTKTGGDVSINIRCSNGSKFEVNAGLTSTVGSFKSLIARSCDIPADQQRLIYKGRILNDQLTLLSYVLYFNSHFSPVKKLILSGLNKETVALSVHLRLEADHTVHLVRGFIRASSPQTTGAANIATSNPTPSGIGVGSDDMASLFPSLNLNGLGGRTGLFDSRLPPFEEIQQQLTQNPNLMSEMMNTPLFQNLMNNTDIIQNMINSNPQLHEIIDRNPELAHVLNDPNTLRQSLETARNPELMREMMRNTDRAMSNIESTPEGFNMLRRMYENVQEPLLNATTMNGDNTNDLRSSPSTALLNTQGGGQEIDNSMSAIAAPVPNSNPLPNPWASGGTGNAQANATARSSPAGLEGMFGSMPDIASFEQFLQNPAMSQMMQNVLSNPEYMNQIMGLNPQMRSIMDSNPQIREMMGNPDFIRQLTSPEAMQQLLTVQETLAQVGRQSATQEAGPNNRETVPGSLNNTGLDMLMGMLGGPGAGNPVIPNQSNVTPEELYATQLSQLQEMGFLDMRENITALMATAGNVHAAVERLLGNLGR